MNLARSIAGLIVGLAFIWIGIAHFANPDAFNEIVPSYLGAPHFWTYSSGIFEIVLGAGIAIPAFRTISARCLVLLVLAMSLANLNMYLNDIPFNGNLLSVTGHTIRLLVQIVLLLLLLWLGAIF